MNNVSMQKLVNQTLNECAAEWQVPVSMLTGREPKTEQEKNDSDEYIAHINRPFILALCARLQAAAIKCDDYHVFVSYSPHVGGLAVYVELTDTEYHNPDRVLDRLIDEMVYIDRADSLEKLTALVDQLQRLGIDV